MAWPWSPSTLEARARGEGRLEKERPRILLLPFTSLLGLLVFTIKDNKNNKQTNNRKLNILNVQFPLLWHSLFIPPSFLFRVFILDKCYKVSMTSVSEGGLAWTPSTRATQGELTSLSFSCLFGSRCYDKVSPENDRIREGFVCVHSSAEAIWWPELKASDLVTPTPRSRDSWRVGLSCLSPCSIV